MDKNKTMNDKFMYIPNDNKQNYPFCRKKNIDTYSLWKDQSKSNKSTQSIWPNEYTNIIIKLWVLV